MQEEQVLMVIRHLVAVVLVAQEYQHWLAHNNHIGILEMVALEEKYQ